MSSQISHQLLNTTDETESDENQTSREQSTQQEDKFLVDFSSVKHTRDEDSHELLAIDHAEDESDEQDPAHQGKEIILGLNGYQLFALFAAWLGWVITIIFILSQFLLSN